jgi:peroxiredoxin
MGGRHGASFRTALGNAGVSMHILTLPKVGGGEIQIGGDSRWQMLVIYRGKHCPLCRKYLKTLNGLLDEFRAIETEVIADSGDPKENAPQLSCAAVMQRSA